MPNIADNTILIVDDDQWLAEQFRHILERTLHCSVMHAADGVEAMDMIDERMPDVIVLDMFMPGPNGLVLLHELQSHADLAAIPVVLCTNSASDVADVDFAQYGVRQVLDKSTMQPDDIVVAMRKVLL